MKSEVEANEAEQQDVATEKPTSAATTRARKLPPSLSQQMRKKTSARMFKADRSMRSAVKIEPTPPPVTCTTTPKPTTAVTVDSDEEDIFDILG
jgi:hypothetical protein